MLSVYSDTFVANSQSAMHMHGFLVVRDTRNAIILFSAISKAHSHLAKRTQKIKLIR